MNNNAQIETADSVKITYDHHSRGLSLRPQRGGNYLMKGAGIAIYRQTQLAQALDHIRKECVFPDSLREQVWQHADFQRLP